MGVHLFITSNIRRSRTEMTRAEMTRATTTRAEILVITGRTNEAEMILGQKQLDSVR